MFEGEGERCLCVCAAVYFSKIKEYVVEFKVLRRKFYFLKINKKVKIPAQILTLKFKSHQIKYAYSIIFII